MSEAKLVTAIKSILPPLVGVCLLATLFPIARPAMTSLHPWKVELLLSVLLLISLAGAFFGRSNGYRGSTLNRFQTSVAIGFGGFVLWGVASSIWAESASSVVHHTFVWVTFIICFGIALLYFDNSRSVSAVARIFTWVTIALAALCLLDYLTLPDFKVLEGTLRIRYGKYAELVVTLLPVIWMSAIYARRKAGYFGLTAVGVAGWLVVMLSLSKGAFIAGVAGFVIMTTGCLFFSSTAFRRKILANFAVWLLLTIAVQGAFTIFSPVPATTDYITGSADSTRETSMMRVFTWKVSGQMFENNWLIGVGADNFGAAFNEARRSFRENNPGDTTIEFGEDYLVERAHNEPIQIAGELGITGLLLLIIPFFLIAGSAYQAFRKNHRRLSPMTWACIGGAVSFGISSCVSSFSFRAVQNGIVFFLVLAIAVHEIGKGRRTAASTVHQGISLDRLRWAGAAALTVLILQVAFFSTRGAAEYLAVAASTVPDHDNAIRLYDNAYYLDRNNPGLMLLSAHRSALAGDSFAAAQKMRMALNDGLGVPTTYSTLAKYQVKAGQHEEAQYTLNEAIAIFPRSVFLRTRLAILFQESGKFNDAEVQLSAAAKIDSRQAAGWYNLIKKGGLVAFLEARENNDLAQPADLMPQSVVREFLGESPEISQR